MFFSSLGQTSWRETYQLEDEEKAFAMALELSRKEHEQRQSTSSNQQHQSVIPIYHAEIVSNNHFREGFLNKQS